MYSRGWRLRLHLLAKAFIGKDREGAGEDIDVVAERQSVPPVKMGFLGDHGDL